MSHHPLSGIPRALATAATLAVIVAASACGDASPTSVAKAQQPAGARFLPTHDQLQAALAAARNTPNGGFNLDMWATVVDRSGIVVAVAFTGTKEGDQWQGSRFISEEKAYTANAFSLPGLALSTANLYFATQPGGSLFGLEGTNPADEDLAYAGKVSDWGTASDPMVGERIGGIVVFGGGVALYASDGTFIGGLGVSGDASCADHNIAWKTRAGLHLDYVPAGVADGGADDNIIYDIANGVSASGFGHPTCSAAATIIGDSLPIKYPIEHAALHP